jgi:hypothetical protein
MYCIVQLHMQQLRGPALTHVDTSIGTTTHAPRSQFRIKHGLNVHGHVRHCGEVDVDARAVAGKQRGSTGRIPGCLAPHA